MNPGIYVLNCMTENNKNKIVSVSVPGLSLFVLVVYNLIVTRFVIGMQFVALQPVPW